LWGDKMILQIPTYLKRKRNINPTLKVMFFALILALITNFLLQLAQMQSNPIKAVVWVVTNMKKFLAGTTFVFFVYLFIIAVFGNLYFSSIAGLILFGGIAYSNLNKLSILGEPLYPVDFYQIRYLSELFEMIGGNISIITVLITITMAAVLIKLCKRLPKLRIGILMRLSLLVLSASMVYSNLNYDKTFMKKFFNKAGIDTVLWNQRENYDNNGFVFGLLSNLQNDVMEMPPDYNEAKVKDIAEKYKKEADKINKERNEKNIQPDIIYIMSEAFWDPARMASLGFSEDPMKNVRQVMAQHSSGWLFSPVYGGGTANTEFEALTGFSMYNIIPGTVPYQQAMDKNKLMPSLVSMLEQQGYESLAMHAYKGMFYKRDRVYNTLGFDDFIDDSKMKYTESLAEGSYISDQAVVNEIIDKLESKEKPTFMHVVTMQNHFPAYEGKHGKASISVTGLSEENTKELEAYAEGIKQSDLATLKLVDYLENYARPTVVVFFGDHLPSLTNSIYEEAKYKKQDANENERLMSETPLFIYSNFEMEKVQLNTVSPAFLGVTLYDILDKPLNPYYAMLENLKSALPGIKSNLLIDSESNMKTEPSEEEKLLLNEYKLIQYDLLMGQQYSLPIMFNEKLQ
jgi:phosphoglycerol transferase MdoB-like AlkP superfamily enzyme